MKKKLIDGNKRNILIDKILQKIILSKFIMIFSLFFFQYILYNHSPNIYYPEKISKLYLII